MTDPQKRALGLELARLRREAGLRQVDLEKPTGRTDATISAIERGLWKRAFDRSLVERYVDHCLEVIGGSKGVSDTRRKYVLGLFDALENLSAAADIASQIPSRNQLPRDTPHFTGRERELSLLTDAVRTARAHDRVIAVHAVDGKPGVGKSAFVTHAGHTLRNRFPDGQLFVNLHAFSHEQPVSPADALAELLSAVGVPPGQLPNTLEKRATLWRTLMADRRVLLVLDNALDDAQVRPLLPGSPSSLVLVTSRHRMTGLDAVTIALDVLAPDAAARMFRRTAQRPLPPGSPVGELMKLAGHLPLAITLLGGRMRNRKALTVEHLVAEMRDGVNRLAALRVRNVEVAAAFELSYRALTPVRQEFFTTLGLHPGPDLDAYAGAALTAGTLRDTTRQLEALYDDNLLDEHVLGRYELHDLIAEYLRGLNEDRDADLRRDAVDRLLDYFQDAALNADRLLREAAAPTPPALTAAARTARDRDDLPTLADRKAAMAWMAAERGNLLACLRTASGSPPRVVTLTAAMSQHLSLSGPWDVAARLHRDAVTAARVLGDPVAEATALLELGNAHRNHGDYPQAETATTAALDAFSTSGDERGQVAALLAQGSVCYLTGRSDDAADRFRQALELSRATGDRLGVANALLELGTLAYLRDDYPEAERQLAKALTLHKELNSVLGRVTALKNLGNTWYFMDQYDQAQDALGEALALSQELGIALVEAQTTTKLGSVLRLMGRYEESVKLLAKARKLATRLADRALEAELLIDYGAALHRLGRHGEAEDAFAASLTLFRAIGEELGMACALKELADMLLDTGRPDEARERLGEAQDLYSKLGERLGLAATNNSLGKLELSVGRTAESAAAHESALDIARGLGSPLEEAEALVGLGRAAEATGDIDTARGRVREALRIQRAIGAAGATATAAFLTELASNESAESVRSQGDVDNPDPPRLPSQ
ncbi:tetratricopeptide repeat protein [Streptomyces tailanensis]|uniref:tetratricopeptide repeat protein n=1 Tax=Streptomyces tailanensis TaxID=2569858 RepID=UPI00155ABA62|nr:tetratricopeptide repeat protein [Streptomyces tailanensis]